MTHSDLIRLNDMGFLPVESDAEAGCIILYHDDRIYIENDTGGIALLAGSIKELFEEIAGVLEDENLHTRSEHIKRTRFESKTSSRSKANQVRKVLTTTKKRRNERKQRTLNGKRGNDMEIILNIVQLAELYGVSPKTIRNWIKKGLPVIRIGRVVRFDKQAVEEWIKKQEDEKK